MRATTYKAAVAVIGTLVVAAMCGRAEAQVTFDSAKLQADDGAAYDYFGAAVAVSGDLALVGADCADPNGQDQCGAAYAFRFVGGAWERWHKLVPPDGNAGDYFGGAVAASGHAMAIGADCADACGQQSGAVYVYDCSGDLPELDGDNPLSAPDGSPGDHFGRALAISENVLVVGADRDDPSGLHSGSAYVFRRIDGAWTFEQKLIASDGMTEAYFGRSVAVENDVIVIGTYHADGCGLKPDTNPWRTGAVYVYRFDGSTWQEQQKLGDRIGRRLDYFGGSVAVSRNWILVGAHRDDELGLQSGSAILFRHDGSGWVQDQKLLPSDGEANDFFGRSVALSGPLAVVGADCDDDMGVMSGSAYVFEYDGQGWVQRQKLLASDGWLGDFLGIAVSVSGDRVLLGADCADEALIQDCGASYVFDLRHVVEER